MNKNILLRGSACGVIDARFTPLQHIVYKHARSCFLFCFFFSLTLAPRRRGACGVVDYSSKVIENELNRKRLGAAGLSHQLAKKYI